MKLKLCSVLGSATFLAVVSLSGCSGSMRGQLAKSAHKEPTHEEMMSMWREYSTPGEAHHYLDRTIGDWKFKSSMWMKADSAPEVSEGTSSIKWILGGRYLKHKVHGTVMGQPFEGIGIVGYNKVANHYESVWIDSMGTAMMTGIGRRVPGENVIKEEGSVSCPMREGPQSFKTSWALLDENHMKYEMFATDVNGREFKSLQIDYERAPAQKEPRKY